MTYLSNRMIICFQTSERERELLVTRCVAIISREETAPN